MIWSVVGWLLFFFALGLVLLVALVHRRGRYDHWSRVVRSGNCVALRPEREVRDWRGVVTEALTAGISVQAIEWALSAHEQPGIRVATEVEVPDGWQRIERDQEMALRVTLPGEGWSESLERFEKSGGLDAHIDSWLDIGAGLVMDRNALVLDRARLVLRAPQVVVEVPLNAAWSGSVSSRVVEWVRAADATGVMVLAALVGAVGLVITGSLVAMAAGVILFVALSGACKFIFMSRRSDPTRERFLQNY